MATIGRPKAMLVVTEAERRELVRLTKRAHVNRAARVSRAARAGVRGRRPNTAVARRHRTTNATVGKWRTRFIERRLDGLYDEPRVGAPRTISDEAVEAVIVKTLETTPKGETHWSTRTMAAKRGHESCDDRPHLAHVWAQTAHHRVVQDLARPATRRQDAGCRRAVYESAAQCGGVLLRREIADPSARAGATHLAHGHRAARTADPQLHPAMARSISSPR